MAETVVEAPAVNTPRGDHSIAELRALVSGKPATPAAEAAPTAKETPAAAGEPAAEPAPASEPEVKQAEGTERGADGKFKAAAAEDDDSELSERVQKRIGKAVKAQREAERRATDAEAKLANQGPRPGDGVKPAATNAPPATTPKPDPAKPETYKAYGDKYEDYLEALTDWKVDQRRAKDNAEAETARAAEAQRKIGESHNARVEKAKADKSDWDETMAEGANVPITRELLDFIRQAEHGPDTAYYLLKHPGEMTALLALAPVLQVAAAANVARTHFEKPAEASTAAAAKKPLPKAASPVGGAAAAKSPDIQDPNISMSEFKRLARAQLPRRA